MTELRLFFRTQPRLCLSEANFECPMSHAELRSTLSGVGEGEGEFQWTSGVQSLVLFFVAAKLHAESSRGQFVFEGAAGTPASSLDYALGKQPSWLLEMFGSDRHGTPTARRIITRFNPERKRGGRVGLGLNTRFLPSSSIRIFLGDRELKTGSDFRWLFGELSTFWSGRKVRQRRLDRSPYELSLPQSLKRERGRVESVHSEHLVPPFHHPQTWNQIFHHFLREVRTALEQTDVSSRSTYARELSDVMHDPSVTRLAGKEVQQLLSLRVPASEQPRKAGAELVSLSRSLLTVEQPLRVAVSPAHAGTLAILTYLRDFRDFNIELNYRYPHSVSLARRMVEQDFHDAQPELCSLTVATASTILGAKLESFSPFLLMPKQSHRVIRSKRYPKEEGTFERYLFMQDIPATESFYYEDMARAGALEKDRSEAVHMEPNDVTWLLSEGDPELRAIIGFPHYTFNILFNGCEPVDPADVSYALKPTVLFGAESFVRNQARREVVEQLVRDAWLTLRKDSVLLQRVIARLLHDGEYLQVLKRCVGLHALPVAVGGGGSEGRLGDRFQRVGGV